MSIRNYKVDLLFRKIHLLNYSESITLVTA